MRPAKIALPEVSHLPSNAAERLVQRSDGAPERSDVSPQPSEGAPDQHRAPTPGGPNLATSVCVASGAGALGRTTCLCEACRAAAAADDSFDVLTELADEITTLAAHIHAAEYRFITLIAEFNRLEGWKPEGHRSCAHWLAFHTGIHLGAARERVRAARALVDLPHISASMEKGELSFAKVRALTRVATPECEGELIELARGSTAAQLERTVRAWRRLSRHDEAELERMRHRSRHLSVLPDEEGMYLVRGRLDPEVGAMLMRALEAAGYALFRKETAEEIEPTHRRADAMGLLAERALAVGFGGAAGAAGAAGEEAEGAEGAEDVEDAEDAEDAEDVEPATEEAADPEATDREQARPTPLSGSRAERYQVVLYVDPPTLEREKHTRREGGPRGSGPSQSSPRNNNEPGRSELEDGTRVSAETSRRLSCDASVVRITEAPDVSAPHGTRVLGVDAPHGRRLLDIGRKARTISPSLRRALESRDRGCRFPGCGLRFTDAHHIEHWADGGETKLRNLVLLCRFHHRLVHEKGYTVHFPRGERFYFLDPRMRLIPDRPPAMPPLSS